VRPDLKSIGSGEELKIRKKQRRVSKKQLSWLLSK